VFERARKTISGRALDPLGVGTLKGAETSKFQTPKKLQAQKPACAPVVRHLFLGLVFEIWNFSGA